MKFSIITPSYNQDLYIENTIESVISQEGNFEIEYIIADGGSIDKSINIIKKYDRLLKNNKLQIKCNGIKLIWWSKNDKGQADAINKGLLIASGDVVAYLNSDDFYLPDTFEKVYKTFSKNPNKMWLTGYCQIVDKKNNEIQKQIKYYKILWLKNYSYNKLCITNFVAQPATFWRRSIHSKIGYFNEKLNYTMDYDFWLRVGKIFDPIIIQNNLSCFRIHTKSKGSQKYNKQFEEDLNLSKMYSKNNFIPFLHSIHNLIIVLIYKIIK